MCVALRISFGNAVVLFIADLVLSYSKCIHLATNERMQNFAKLYSYGTVNDREGRHDHTLTLRKQNSPLCYQLETKHYSTNDTTHLLAAFVRALSRIQSF